jgi:hypothetical protein
MPVVAHCRHCFGDCDGDCLLPGGGGLCIHKPVPKRTLGEWLALLRTRRFWSRVSRASRLENGTDSPWSRSLTAFSRTDGTTSDSGARAAVARSASGRSDGRRVDAVRIFFTIISRPDAWSCRCILKRTVDLD